MVSSVYGPSFISMRKGNTVKFSFDDVSATASSIDDNSMNVIVYTNVHYLLDKIQQESAIKKIWNKLVPGGMVYFSDPDGNKTSKDFERYFGIPIKTIEKGGVKVFRKHVNR